MSLPLKDLRFGVCIETHSVLSAHARVHDKDLYDVIRKILDEWARNQLLVAEYAKEEMRVNGLTGSN